MSIIERIVRSYAVDSINVKPKILVRRFTKSRKHYIELLFDPRDMWIGLYWSHNVLSECWHFYICILPLLPVHVCINYQAKW